MLNKLNISGTIGVFSFLEIYSFSLRLHIEFDKNANSSYVSVLYTFRISLLSDKSEFVFFVRDFGCALFIYMGEIMFISFSKTIARFGGFRLGVGMRVNKKNAIWMSFLVMFIAMFKAMWYMMVLCGWMVYAVCYGMYWCIKKIVEAATKSSKSKSTQSTYIPKSNMVKDEEDIPSVSEDTNNTTCSDSNNSNNEFNGKPPKKKSAIARWIIGAIIAMFVFVNGFHFSSIFILASAFLMLPLPFMDSFLKKINVKFVVAIILSVVLLFVGILTSPSEATEDPSDDTNQSEVNGDDSNSGDSSSNQNNQTNTTDKYSNLKLFITEYNKIANTDITNTIEIDIQSPEYYRTEFRLNAYKDAPAYKGNLGNNSIEIINSNYNGTFGSDLRIYTYVDTIEEATSFFEAFCKSCNSNITQADFDDFYSYHSFDNQYGCSVTLKGISGYVNKKADGFDIMLDADPDYFDN